MKVNDGDIDADDYTYHFYYIIKFCLSPFTLQSDLSIDGQVMYYGDMVFEVTFFSPININF